MNPATMARRIMSINWKPSMASFVRFAACFIAGPVVLLRTLGAVGST
jgi:hypothetical protein